MSLEKEGYVLAAGVDTVVRSSAPSHLRTPLQLEVLVADVSQLILPVTITLSQRGNLAYSHAPSLGQ